MSLIVALDAETTSPRPGQICQLALIARESGRDFARNDYFSVDEMTQRSLGVHHLTREALYILSGGARFSDRAKALLETLNRADLIVAHSAKSDIEFLTAEFDRLGMTFSPRRVLCTRDLYVRTRRVRDGLRVAWPPLQRVLDYYGIGAEAVSREAQRLFSSPGAPHDARWDAAAALMIARAAGEAGDLAQDILDLIRE